jgi:hypothetical protein
MSDLLERQVCNCMDAKGKTPKRVSQIKVECLRCELLRIARGA